MLFWFGFKPPAKTTLLYVMPTPPFAALGLDLTPGLILDGEGSAPGPKMLLTERGFGFNVFKLLAREIGGLEFMMSSPACCTELFLLSLFADMDY